MRVWLTVDLYWWKNHEGWAYCRLGIMKKKMGIRLTVVMDWWKNNGGWTNCRLGIMK